MMNILADFSFVQWILVLATLGVCGLLILVVLVQQASGGGLVGAFGGGGASGAFGAKTGDMFTVITVVLASVFLLLNVLGNYALTPAVLPSGDPALTSADPEAAPPAETAPTSTDSPAADLDAAGTGGAAVPEGASPEGTDDPAATGSSQAAQDDSADSPGA